MCNSQQHGRRRPGAVITIRRVPALAVSTQGRGAIASAAHIRRRPGTIPTYICILVQILKISFALNLVHDLL